MAILSLYRESVGQVGMIPGSVRMISTDSLATVTTAGYLSNSENSPARALGLMPSDIITALYGYSTTTGTGTLAFFQATLSNGIWTLVVWENPGNVILPVVSGDFANFSGTTGAISDAGFSPSNATKTKVVMANGAVTANHIGVFTDTAGTLGQDAATAINGGNIQAGLSGTAGTLASYPGTASNGSLIVKAINNSGGFNSTISNGNIGQATVYSLTDSGTATTNFLISDSTTAQVISTGGLDLSVGSVRALQGNFQAGSSGHAGTFTSFPGTASQGTLVLAAVNNSSNHSMTISNAGAVGQVTVVSIPDPGAATASFDLSQSGATALTNKIFVKTITATAAALATAGHVTVMAHPSATSQFKVMNIRVMYAAAGLSGGAGDRLLNLTDGTIVFNQNGITAALLGTPVYTLWGGTGNPLPGSVSTVSTAGADIYLVYAGGANDYTTGQIVIEVELAQVTA